MADWTLRADASKMFRGALLTCGVALRLAALAAAGDEAPIHAMPNLELRGNFSVPAMGLTTYRMMPGEETENSVRWALELGYRMIDTASVFRNEESVGKAILESGVPREDIFIQTKLWGDDHGYDAALKAGQESIKKLGLKYVDLYVIHSPVEGKLIETWDALLELQAQGLVRHIGVSNFGLAHLEALERHGRPLPVTNQLEMHPLVFKDRQALVDWCKARQILVQAQGMIWTMVPSLRPSDVKIQEIAATLQRSTAQVLLRWGFQKGFQLILRTTRKDRLKENFNILDFSLSDDHMEQLGHLEGELFNQWNPLNEPVDLGETHHWKLVAKSALNVKRTKDESYAEL